MSNRDQSIDEVEYLRTEPPLFTLSGPPMTPKRLAELRDRWSGGAHEELFAAIDALQRRVEALEGLLERVLLAEDPDEYLNDVQAALRGAEETP